MFDRSVKVAVDVGVGEAKDGHADRLKIIGAPFFIIRVSFLVMLSAIQFDSEFYARRVKINDIIADPVLTSKIDGARFQIRVPKHPFLTGGVALPTILSCEEKVVFVVPLHRDSIRRFCRVVKREKPPLPPVAADDPPLQKGVKPPFFLATRRSKKSSPLYERV